MKVLKKKVDGKEISVSFDYSSDTNTIIATVDKKKFEGKPSVVASSIIEHYTGKEQSVNGRKWFKLALKNPPKKLSLEEACEKAGKVLKKVLSRQEFEGKYDTLKSLILKGFEEKGFIKKLRESELSIDEIESLERELQAKKSALLQKVSVPVVDLK